jgi:hypothetical protein
MKLTGQMPSSTSLIRALVVELVEEIVEAGLLLQAVHARRSGGFLLKGEAHTLVAAVLLRVAWLDTLDIDANT